MKALAHPLGENQRFQLKASPHAPGLIHAIVVEIGEVISLSEREKKGSLRDQPELFKARPLAALLKCGEIHMRREVLLTWRGIEVLRRAVIGIGKDRAGHVVGVERSGASCP